MGKFVDKFEEMTAQYTGALKAVVCVNGTEALHMALMLSGVKAGDEVITQPLTFVATANAIVYTGAHPVFIDVDMDTMGLSPASLEEFLIRFGDLRNDGYYYNKVTGNRISACVPMHTFGHPVKIEALVEICEKYNITLVEDAAESIGSKYKGKHTGTFGKFGIISYNGNKTITTGGGGMILTNDEGLGNIAKHLTTQAKISHPWEYAHDHIGYNYRMPNINAALGVAQMESLDIFIKKKREIAAMYKLFFESQGIHFFSEPDDCYSNYWLNAIILNSKTERDQFLKFTNSKRVMTRPIWKLLNKLSMFKNSFSSKLSQAEWLEERVVNLPSSYMP